MLSYVLYLIYEDPQMLNGYFLITEFVDITVGSFHDIHGWALKRLTVDPVNPFKTGQRSPHQSHSWLSGHPQTNPARRS
jgi:hypothetical protein